jgi:hypothetical protein
MPWFMKMNLHENESPLSHRMSFLRHLYDEPNWGTVTGNHESQDQHEWLAKSFEAERAHLRAVAYRMLGSGNEADDAVQEVWLRLSRSDSGAIKNLGGWLTTVVARIYLDVAFARSEKRGFS